MPRTVTPVELAAEVGVSPSAVRYWLRHNVPRAAAGAWQIDADTAARARAHFAATQPARTRIRDVCLVAGCERMSAARGMCRMHYQRWYSTGVDPNADSGSTSQM
jgi:hypothetical protein